MKTLLDNIRETVHSLYTLPFEPELSPPPKKELGDYCFSVFALAKQVGKNPAAIATEISNEMVKYRDSFTSSTSLGGFVNFTITTATWQEIFQGIRRTPHEKINKTIIVEPFSANIGKPLHIGHLCPTSIGQSIMNIHAYLGWRVISDNHMGDWGALFGKLIVGYERYGDTKKLEEEAVNHLFEIYVKVTKEIETDPTLEDECRKAFKLLSDGDKKSMDLWRQFTLRTVESAYAVISRLNIHLDYAIGESFYEGLPLPKIGDHPDLIYSMKDIVKELINKGIAIQNEDGSVGVVFPDEFKLPSNILAKRDGTHGYFASDLATIKYRMTNGWKPNKIAICADNRQRLHFQQVIATAKLAGWIYENYEFIHIENGFISLPDGAMSSRKGRIVRLEGLLEEGYNRTKAILESKNRILAEEDIREIAIGAIKYSYLMQDRERNIVFDWDKALNFEGHSGPYIQYAYVRATKIAIQTSESLIPSEFNHNTEISPHDKSLLRELGRMEDEIVNVSIRYKPHTLALYCYDLAVSFNSFYVHTPKILEESDKDLQKFRLALCQLTAEKLQLGFHLLGIKMPNEM